MTWTYRVVHGSFGTFYYLKGPLSRVLLVVCLKSIYLTQALIKPGVTRFRVKV